MSSGLIIAVHEEFSSVGKDQYRSWFMRSSNQNFSLPISAFRSTFEIAKLDDGTEDITFTLKVFQVEKFDIAIADRVRKMFQGNVLWKITLEGVIPFAFAQNWIARRRGVLRKQDARSRACNGGPELDCSKLNNHAPVTKESRMDPVMPVNHTKSIHI
ncbi:hypothetical protein N7532_001324 [Penicillium argentinense]|uniref:Uncharacterized protein n=1 Tax=Penicillium argentinense TaxID=1131581 RepID=A0A9W9KL49_9EURO|nr:uncharacterized protein N7532_001324 [Penicillium argentinense]KAJ5110789.1 hypothetical protein N7532_001324 [Penicillium argentinense]